MTPDFWMRIALAVPIIFGVWTLFGEGMLLGWLGDIWERRLPDVLRKPLFSCPPCMSSTYGTAIWFLTGGSADGWWIAFCLALCGLLKLIAHNLLKDA